MKSRFSQILTWGFAVFALTWLLDWIALLSGSLIPLWSSLPFRVSHFLKCMPLSILLIFVFWTFHHMKHLHQEVDALRQEMEHLKQEQPHT